MGWSIGFDDNWKRDIGYGVPAVCDHPKCQAEIDRGLSYVCGGEPYGGDLGCGLYFCSAHLYFGRAKDAPQLCLKCYRYDHKPYKPKPDTKEWVDFKMTDPSWAAWRAAQKELASGLAT
jgi:hypothetical protein